LQKNRTDNERTSAPPLRACKQGKRKRSVMEVERFSENHRINTRYG